MENLAGGILLAAISGLTYLAYKHPIAYNRLQWALRVAIIGLMFGVLLWDASSSQTYFALIGFMPPEKLADASNAIKAAQIATPLRMALLFGLWIYLEFIGFLPYLIGEEDKPKK